MDTGPGQGARLLRGCACLCTVHMDSERFDGGSPGDRFLSRPKTRIGDGRGVRPAGAVCVTFSQVGQIRVS